MSVDFILELISYYSFIFISYSYSFILFHNSLYITYIEYICSNIFFVILMINEYRYNQFRIIQVEINCTYLLYYLFVHVSLLLYLLSADYSQLAE